MDARLSNLADKTPQVYEVPRVCESTQVYEAIDGNTANLVIESKAHGTQRVLVDAGQVPRLKEQRWHVMEYENYGVTGLRVKSADNCGIARFLMDTPEGSTTVHLNDDGLDARICNLQIRKSSELYKGVFQAGDKWIAERWVEGKRIALGTFDSETEAFTARTK
jgi:hypothetical protein